MVIDGAVSMDAGLQAAARARVYFKEYMEYVHGWKARAHQESWAEALEALYYGDLRLPQASGGCPRCLGRRGCSPEHRTHKLIIEAFPGAGKSDSLVEWAAWVIGNECALGRMPQGGYISYSDDVAQLRSVAVRDTIESNARYREVFPEAVPDKAKGWGQGEWFLKRADPGKKDPTLRAAGFGGSILSYRFPTFEIIDDPHDPRLVKTPGQRDETWRLWRQAARTRVVQGVTPMALICTRFAADDLSGRLKQVEGDWAVLHTPALDESQSSVWLPEVVDGQPMGIATKVLEQMRREDRISFLTQYMALPPSAEGDMFRFFTEGPKPWIGDVTVVFQAWDTATTTKSYSSYNAMVEFWKLKNGRAYINRVINKKLSPSELTDLIPALYWEAENEVGAGKVYLGLENAQAGPAFVEFIRTTSGIPYHRVKLCNIPGAGRGGKRGPADLVARAVPIVKHFEYGLVYWNNDWEPWKDEYIAQLREFPHSPRTDMTAATCVGLEELFPRYAVGPPPPLVVSYSGW